MNESKTEIAATECESPEEAMPSCPQGPKGGQSVALTGIFVLLIFYTLYLAAPVLMPVTLAVLMSLVLSPVVKRLAAWRLPRPLAAALVILGLLGLLSGAIYALSGPAGTWVEEIPQNVQQVEHKLQPHLQSLLHYLEHTYAQLSLLVGDNAEAGAIVPVQRNPLSHVLISGTPEILGGIGGLAVIFVLLYFLLASPGLARRILYLAPDLASQRRVKRIVRALEHDVSIYLFTITLINIGLGLSVALVSYLFGLPNPLLWGGMVTLLNFAPYIGASISFLVLGFVALLTFEHPLHALLVPASFLGLSFLEGQFITPTLIGRNLDLSPVLVFVSVLVWGWMWGFAGVLLAVPLLASVKIVSERIDALRPFSRFLSN
jgi:predicted PurR-regulated permease PerM